MNKKQLEKNKLDLEYHKYTQLLNGIFIFGTTGLLGFIGSFVWGNKSNLLIGIIISTSIIIVAYFLYKNVNNRLEEISKEIQNLK